LPVAAVGIREVYVRNCNSYKFMMLIGLMEERRVLWL